MNYSILLKLEHQLKLESEYHMKKQVQGMVFENPKVIETAFYRRKVLLKEIEPGVSIRMNTWNVHQL